MKMFVVSIGVLLLLSLFVVTFSHAGRAACKDYFSVCTEGGCANFNVTGECKLFCVNAMDPTEGLKVHCDEPGSLGDGDSVPNPGAP